jgi:LCP family protein required for cell wall assembly
MYLLGVGVDSGSGSYLYGLGDVIRVARVDFVTPSVVVLSIPRDLWVEIPEINDHYDITHGKLNQAFLFGGPGMGYYDGPGGGAGLLARTLALNYGIYVDHYGVVDMLAFAEIVDAVGGIDINLPNNVDGRPLIEGDEDFGFFYAGQHHFTGAEALRFARVRERYNDFVRVENQNLVLSALREKLLKPEVLPKVPQLIDAVMDKVLTDLSPQQISQLVCLLPKLTGKHITLTSFPLEIFTSDRIYSPIQKDYVYILGVDNAVIRGYVEQFNAGTWP